MGSTNGIEAIAAAETADFAEEEADDGVEVAVACVPEDPAYAEFECFWVFWYGFEQPNPYIESETFSIFVPRLLTSLDRQSTVVLGWRL
jgi:hypothetical protein